MVDPISREERSASARRLKAGFVVLVAASGGLITLGGGAPLGVVAGATAVGGLVGVGLVWLVFPGDGGVRRRDGSDPGGRDGEGGRP